MKIYVTAGRGEGSTTLSAFDAALKDAGIYNYNLIRLSSIIPPGSEIVQKKWKTPPSDYGNKLYVVLAEGRTDQLNHSIAAGIGWYQFGEDKRGVFVEHHDIVESLNTKEAERKIAEQIENSIKDLLKNRHIKFEGKKLNMKIHSYLVTSKPSCCLVLAIFKSEKF